MENNSFKRIGDIVSEQLKLYRTANNDEVDVTGIGTGFTNLDRITGGFQKGDLIIVGARPAIGKTAFALSVANNIAIRQKKHVLLFSLEMGKEQIANKVLMMEVGVDIAHLKSGKLSADEWDDLIKSAKKLSAANLIIDDTPGITTDEILERCTCYKEKQSIDLVIVDYLQLLGYKGNSPSRRKELEDIHIKLKEIARKIEVPVMVLTQLSRAIEQREDHHPVLSDLREPCSIEQDADTIMFIYRDEYYNKDSVFKGIAEIIVVKQRSGRLGTAYLSWNSRFAKFENYDEGVPVEQVSPDLIIEQVCKSFDVKKSDVFSRKRNTEIVTARQVIMYLCRSYTDLSLEEIGEKLGKNDHTTVMSGISKVKKMLEIDQQFSDKIECINKGYNKNVSTCMDKSIKEDTDKYNFFKNNVDDFTELEKLLLEQ